MDKKRLTTALKVIAIPVVYAIVLRLIFGVSGWKELFSVMSITFLFFLPTIVGALTVYFSDIAKVQKIWYRIFVPWIPIFFFLRFPQLTINRKMEVWTKKK